MIDDQAEKCPLGYSIGKLSDLGGGLLCVPDATMHGINSGSFTPGWNVKIVHDLEQPVSMIPKDVDFQIGPDTFQIRTLVFNSEAFFVGHDRHSEEELEDEEEKGLFVIPPLPKHKYFELSRHAFPEEIRPPKPTTEATDKLDKDTIKQAKAADKQDSDFTKLMSRVLMK